MNQLPTDNYKLLTQAPVGRAVRQMAWPAVLTMLTTSFYNMADTCFVGRIDTQSTAAVGVAYAAMCVVQAVGFFFGHGSGNYISRQLGARQTDEARRMARAGVLASLVVGLLLGVAGLMALPWLCRLLGATPTVMPPTMTYLGIVLLATPMMTASMTLNNQLRFCGSARLAMRGVMVGAGVNLMLDPLLIFVFDWGLTGAAWATFIGQTAGFAMLWYYARRHADLQIRLRFNLLARAYIIEMVRGGSPSLMRQGLASVSVAWLNVAAGVYGDAAIAGMSVVGRISFFLYAVVVGLGQGFQPLCGFCYGAGLYRRVKAGFAYCVRVGTVFLTVCALLAWPLAEPAVALFRDEAEVVAVGASALRWQLLAWPLIPFIVLTNMYLQTIGSAVRANLVAAARNGLFFLPLIVWLPSVWGRTGVECCQALSDVCSFALALPVCLGAFRAMMRRGRPSEPEGRLLKKT